MGSITLHNLDGALHALLKQKARREGMRVVSWRDVARIPA